MEKRKNFVSKEAGVSKKSAVKERKMKQPKVKNKKAKDKKKGNSVKNSLLVTMMAATLLPIIVLGIILAIVSTSKMNDVTMEEAKASLGNVASVVESALDTMYEGSYVVDDRGRFFKGETLMSGQDEILEKYKGETDMEIALSCNGVWKLTTILDEHERQYNGIEIPVQLDQKVIQTGQDYFTDSVEVNGVEYYAYCSPTIDEQGTITGLIFVGTPASIANERNTAAVAMISLIAVLVVAAAAVVAAMFSIWLVRFLKTVTGYQKEVSNGDLTVVVDKKILARKDELGMMATSTEQLRQSLVKVIGSLQDSAEVLVHHSDNLESTAEQTNLTTNEVTKAIDDISQGAMAQADETQVAQQNIMEIGDLIENITDEVVQLTKNSQEMIEAEEEANEIIGELDKSNTKTIDAVQRIAEQTETTNESAQQIRKVVDFITSIAEETNLLSLNASIEAARAGEQGRGFAVVAGQIQKLAEQSNVSAQQIKSIIDVLLEDSEKTVEIMEEVKGNVANQQEKLIQTKDKFKQVSDGIEVSRGNIMQIKDKTEVLNVSRQVIVDVIQNLSAITEENAAAAEQTTASTEELNSTIDELADAAKDLKDLAVNLEKEMSVFKVD